MTDSYRVRTRIEEIRKRLRILEKEFKNIPEEKLILDEVLYASAERHLEVAIQAIIDIANHLVSSLGLERPKNEAGEALLTIAKEKIITMELAEKLKRAVGYRNVLVHDYMEVERHYTFENIQEGLPDLVEYCKQVELFLQKQGK